MQARSCLLLLALGLVLAACSRPDPVFLPQKGERLIGLGQPLNEPADVRLWQPPPALVMSYTALPGLPGITEAIDVGSGQAYLDEQMRRYPHSARSRWACTWSARPSASPAANWMAISTA